MFIRTCCVNLYFSKVFLKGRLRMKEKKVIPIVSAVDDHYAPYLSVMMMTLLEHLADGVAITFYIIDDCISKESKEKLAKAISNKPAEIHYLKVGWYFLPHAYFQKLPLK